jgi:hypothetical protein
MAWLLGIDEAGYGPNLGPLVLTAVAVRPPTPPTGDLWRHLRAGVRRHGEADDGRLLVDDSKKVYSTTRGLAALEHGVLATLFPATADLPATLADYAAHLCPDSLDDLADEPCYRGTLSLPVGTTAARWRVAADRFARSTGAVVAARSLAVPAGRFNALLAGDVSKSATLGAGLVRLLRWADAALPAGEAVSVAVDKQGGRNFYGPLIRAAFPGSRLRTEEESAECSRYRLDGASRAVDFVFVPRADGEHLPVALASMASKYLRELLMAEFNAFWQERLPGLKPTAGYPQDARRFMEAIRPLLPELGLDEDRVWRRK